MLKMMMLVDNVVWSVLDFVCDELCGSEKKIRESIASHKVPLEGIGFGLMILEQHIFFFFASVADCILCYWDEVHPQLLRKAFPLLLLTSEVDPYCCAVMEGSLQC